MTDPQPLKQDLDPIKDAVAIHHQTVALARKTEQYRIGMEIDRLYRKWHIATPDERPDLFDGLDAIRAVVWQ